MENLKKTLQSCIEELQKIENKKIQETDYKDKMRAESHNQPDNGKFTDICLELSTIRDKYKMKSEKGQRLNQQVVILIDKIINHINTKINEK